MLPADESTPCKAVLCTQDSDPRSKPMDFDAWMVAFDLGETPDQAFAKWAEETNNAHLI